MGFYSEKILPHLLDWSMSGPLFSRYRQEVLADVQGKVLEIGFGTGLNLAYYPETVQEITTVDVNPGMHSLAQKRVRQSDRTVKNQVLSSENLPMDDATFDSVVSTWTLCSIADVDQALQEIHRVLKPGGRFFFIEHGLSDKPGIQTWQHRLTPIQKVIGDGCHLNRNIEALVKRYFHQVNLTQFTPDNLPDLAAHFYKGVAVKENA